MSLAQQNRFHWVMSPLSELAQVAHNKATLNQRPIAPDVTSKLSPLFGPTQLAWLDYMPEEVTEFLLQ